MTFWFSFNRISFILSLLHRKWWIRVYRKVPFILTKYTSELTKNGHKFISVLWNRTSDTSSWQIWFGRGNLWCNWRPEPFRQCKSSERLRSAQARFERLGRIAIRNGMWMYSSVQGRVRGQRSALWGTALIHTVALRGHRKTKTLRKTTISNTVSKNGPVIK